MPIELELDTSLRFDGEVFDEGTPASKLPKKARDAARSANGGKGIYRVQRVDDDDLERALAELEEMKAEVETLKADKKQAKEDEKNAAKEPTPEDPLTEAEIKEVLAPEESEDEED